MSTSKLVFKIAAGTILFFSVLYLVLYLRPSETISKQTVKEKITLPGSKFTQWRGAEIHYVDEGSGFPIVMIHGLGGSHRNFSKFAPLLTQNFRVIRVDLPGFGLSDLPALGENENVADVYRSFITFFINDLKLDSFHLIGNSMGGGVSWLTAIDHPEKVKKLMLCASAGYDMDKIAASVVGMVRNPITASLAQKGVPKFICRGIARRCRYDDSKINDETVSELHTIMNRETNIQSMLQLTAFNNFPDSALIQQVKTPTLLVWGKYDEIIPVEHADRFHRDLPNNQLILFDSCGHLPMQEKPQELYTAYLKFLNS